MAKIISKNIYEGIDWHDKTTYEYQVGINGDYNTKDVVIPDDKINDVILKNIIKSLTRDGVFPYNLEKIKEVLFDETKTKKYVEPEPNASEFKDDNGEIFYSDDISFYWYDFKGNKLFSIGRTAWCGQWESTTHYYLDPEPINKGYMVTERFGCPAKGTPTVERLFHDVFDTYEEAKTYFDAFECLNQEKTRFGSEKQIAICDKDKIKETEWYRLNKEAATLMREKGVSKEDDTFSIFVETHIKHLKGEKEEIA
jgi:hypothetical protein